MKLAMFDMGTGAQTGVVLGEEIVSTGFSGSMIDLISRWDDQGPGISNVSQTSERFLLSKVKVLAPVQRPGKIFAIGLNYADHIKESGMETPKDQVWFTKAVTCVNGPYDPIEVPTNAPYVDYEVELVAIIGKGGRNISATDAESHIFGYTVGNDVTERMWQHRTPQWSLGKSFDTHAPIGPWITTADELGDPHSLDLRCSVNGEIRQSSNTRHLVFNVWDQVAHLSQAMTLEPGDLIFTGTPSGIGAVMEPRQFLKPGDVLRSEISKLGVIEAMMQSV
jgi:2-keto-4-pentenoate hydratase/2-oxohepta-3-ene-1,7-dioic acid hydratase in catechol pathway